MSFKATIPQIPNLFIPKRIYHRFVIIIACTCNTLGTIDNQGCNMLTGECTCKRYVTARDCNQCLPEYWGLSEDRDGCKPCDCDPGGSYENSCDVVTGQCRCRPHVSGRTCNQPEQSYYTGSLDFLIYEGELSRATDVSLVNKSNLYQLINITFKYFFKIQSTQDDTRFSV